MENAPAQIKLRLKRTVIALAAILSVAWSGFWLAHRRNPELWRVNPRRLVFPDGQDSGGILALRFPSDGSQLLAFDANGALFELDSDNRRLLSVRTIPPQPKVFSCAAFTSDGSRLATGDAEGVLQVWDTKSGRVIWESREHPDGIHLLDISANDQKIVTAGGMRLNMLMDNDVRVWDMHTGKLLHRFANDTAGVSAVTLNARGGLVAVSNIINGRNRRILSDDCKIRVWDLESGDESNDLPLLEGDCESLAFARSAQSLLFASSGPAKDVSFPREMISIDPSVRAFDLKTSAPMRLFSKMKTDSSILEPIYMCVLKEDSIGIWNNGSTLTFWNERNGRVSEYLMRRAWNGFQMAIHSDPPFAHLSRTDIWPYQKFALSPGGDRLAMAYQNKISVWDIQEALEAIR